MFFVILVYTLTLQLNGFPKHARKIDKNWLVNNLCIYKINKLYKLYSFVELYQKT